MVMVVAQHAHLNLGINALVEHQQLLMCAESYAVMA